MAFALAATLLRGPALRALRQPSRAASSVAAVGDDCWRCGSCENKWKLFCGSCDALQPPPAGEDYFELFDLPQAFEVDVAALELAYKNIQKKVHPDLQSGREETEQRLADDVSARFNDAYKVLRDPLTRAQHLLSLQGFDPLAEGAVAPVDPTLLMAVMEGREALAAATSTQQVEAIGAENAAAVEGALEELSQCLGAGDMTAAAALLVRLQYLTKMTKEVEARGEAVG